MGRANRGFLLANADIAKLGVLCFSQRCQEGQSMLCQSTNTFSVSSCSKDADERVPSD